MRKVGDNTVDIADALDKVQRKNDVQFIAEDFSQLRSALLFAAPSGLLRAAETYIGRFCVVQSTHSTPNESRRLSFSSCNSVIC